MSNNPMLRSLHQMLRSVVSEELLSQIEPLNVQAITLDSRCVTSGGLFVALGGANTDGRLYIDAAIEKGAVAVLCELDNGRGAYVELSHSTPIIYIPNLALRLSHIASEFYQHPQNEMVLIGITGTNGKTTVTQLICQWLEKLGHTTYSMGTLGNGLTGQLVESPNTTLNAIDLMANLANAKQLGAQYVVMEVSSHGIELGRVDALTFDISAFTNLSQDHLDFHGNMESYADAKKQLFSAKFSKQAVLNGNDNIAFAWAQDWHYENPLSSYNQKLPHANDFVLANDVIYSTDGISAVIDASFGQGQLNAKLLGQFNLDNLLCAINVLCLAGFELAQVLKIAPSLASIPGRMEVFQHGNSPTVVVDYAHTPDALTQTIKALRRHCQGKLSVLFGCGGDRDNSKRPLMAQAASANADSLIVTQDNSRSEPFEQILTHIMTGFTTTENIVIEENRAKAVKLAVSNAKFGDIVLLAGKGHENYQIIGNQCLDYDERALAKSLVEAYL